jgi:hypothetical protein
MHFIVVLLLVRSHNGSARVWFQPGLFKSVFSKRPLASTIRGLGFSNRFPIRNITLIETARQGYLRSYPVGKSVRASGVQ